MSALPQAVVWDLDGTLIDSAADLAAVLNALLGENGLAPLSVDEVKMMIGGGIARLVQRGCSASGRDVTQAELAALSERFLQRYAESATDRTTLYPGVAEVLPELRRLGLRQAVCTNKPWAIARSILRDLGIAGYFSAIVGGDSTAEKKPHPLPLLACLESLRVAKADAVMVGDSAADVAAGHAAGLPVVLVRHGYSNEPLEGLGAEVLIDGLTQLPETLATLRRAA